jgi:hypothetical protein
MEAVWLPQFNWSVFGPILLVLAVVSGGLFYLASRSSSGPAHHAALVAATAPMQAALSATPNTAPAVPAGGVRLPGRAMGSPHLRASPSSEAAVVGDLHNGEDLQASGCNASCGWYLVTPSGRAVSGWVSAAFVTVQGDDRTLPVVR